MTRDVDVWLDVTMVARLVSERAVSATEVVTQALGRIQDADWRLGAFCTLCVDEALHDAAALDQRLRRGDVLGPLAGVPVAIKDLLSTCGVRTTFGSQLYAKHVPDRDDVAVERLRRAGAIVIGKTNTSEFGYGAISSNSLFPATRNPWNTALTPGGSSAGSAAAVAAGLVPLALGSDGGGSIRVPAALTGIVGFKPSFGRVPVFPGCRDETMPGASGWEALEHIGPMARSVSDVALAFAVLAGPDPHDRHSVPLGVEDWTDLAWRHEPGLRLAYSGDLGFAHVDPEVADLTQAAAVALAEAAGATLHFDGPAIGDVQATFEALVALDTDRAGLRRLAAESGIRFGPTLEALLETEWTADDFTAAIMDRKRIARVMGLFMSRNTVLLTPAVAVPAFALSDGAPSRIGGASVGPAGWAPFSALADLTGQPAISVPAGFTRDGRPFGLQIMGRHLDDLCVLRVAALLEAARPWRNQYPSMERLRSNEKGEPNGLLRRTLHR